MSKRLLFLLLLFILLHPPSRAMGQELSTRQGEITSPVDGQAVRGTVPIEGSTPLEGLLWWELNYSYTKDPTGTWFFITEGKEPLEVGLFTNWNTNQITDGDYNLRLTIFLEGDQRTDSTIQNLRVRNYTAVETDTPHPTTTPLPYTETPSTSLSLTGTASVPSPTPLPTNILELPPEVVSNTLLRGAAGVLALFLLMGLYTTVKRSTRK